MNRFLTFVVTVVAGFVLVACGPAGSSGSSEPSSAASTAASEAPGSSDVAGPSLTEGAVPDLEALIPNTVGTMTLHKTSTRGDQFLTSDSSDPDLVKFVSELGVKPSDISIAIGFGGSTDGSFKLGMFVFRASGVDTDRLVSAFKEATDSDRQTPLAWSNATVGGKQVEKAVDGADTFYLYAKDDILFFLSGDPASSAEVISGLP